MPEKSPEKISNDPDISVVTYPEGTPALIANTTYCGLINLKNGLTKTIIRTPHNSILGKKISGDNESDTAENHQ